MPSAKIKGTDLRVYATYESRSSPGVRYNVVVNASNVPVACNCPGWVYRKKCRHVEKVRKMILEKYGVE
jgi:hypothetical protein